jgi:hypothetical protein
MKRKLDPIEDIGMVIGLVVFVVLLIVFVEIYL